METTTSTTSSYNKAVNDNARLFQGLNCEQQQIIRYCAVFSEKRHILLDAFVELIGEEKDETIAQLCESGWLARTFDTLHIEKWISDALTPSLLSTKEADHLVSRLLIHTRVHPLDDLMAKKPFFAMAVALLVYILTHESDYADINHDKYALLAAQVAAEADLAYDEFNPRPRIEQYTDSDIYKVLSFAQRKATFRSVPFIRVCLQLAMVHNRIFSYYMAFEHLRYAKTVARCFPFEEAKVSMAEAEVYANKSLFAQAMTEKKRAFDCNEKYSFSDDNIIVALNIALYCSFNGMIETSKKWLRIADQLTGQREVPVHSKAGILRSILFSTLYPTQEENYALAMNDEVANTVRDVYGEVSTTSVLVALMRYAIISDPAQRCSAYARYVRLNRACNGQTAGGEMVILYCHDIGCQLEQGNYEKAVNVAKEMMTVSALKEVFPPGVSLSYYSTLGHLCTYVTEQYDMARSFIMKGLEVIDKEMNPSYENNKDVIGEVADLKDIEDGNDLTNDDAFIQLSVMLSHISLREGDAKEAVAVLERALPKIHNSAWQRNLRMRISDSHAEAGNHDEALAIWDKVVEEDASFAMAAATSAFDADLPSDAMRYLQMAKESDMGEDDLLTAGNIYTYMGLPQADHYYQKALSLTPCNDKRISILKEMASNRSDNEAEKLLRKAVGYDKRLHKPWEKSVARACLYRDYAVALGMQGKYPLAKWAAYRAVSLYPSSVCPDDFTEDIQSYL